MEAGLTSGHHDTIHSCNSSSYASEFLQLYNPKDAEVESPDNAQKRFKPTIISYAVAVNTLTQAIESPPVTQIVSVPPNTQQSSSISSLTDQDLDRLHDRLKHHVITDDAFPGISTEELERQVAESNLQINQVKEEMRASVA